MGTRGWTLPAFVGCCLWVLHGLGAAVAVPLSTEGPLGAHTASPTAAQSEARGALTAGTAGTSSAVADTETTQSILAGRPASPTFPSGVEADLVTATSAAPAAGSDAEAEPSPGAATQAPSGEPQAVTDVATALNASQGNQTVSAAALVFTPQPAFTPSSELGVTGAAPAAPPGATPLFADVLASVTREGADLEPTDNATSLPTTLPPAAAGAEPTTGSPPGPHVTALLSQGLATAMGAVEEGVTLPGDSHGEGSAPSSIPSPEAEGLLTTQWDEALSGTGGVTAGPAAPGSGDAGDAEDGAVGTTESSHLAPESGTVSGAAENPGQVSLLAGQAGLSPATSPGGGDGDVQGAPAVSPASPGSPGERGDTATSLLASRAPTDAQSDTDAPASSIALPLPTGAVGPAEPSLQPAPWQSPTGEEQPQHDAALLSPTDTPSAPGAAFPPPGAATADGAETTANPDLGAAPGVPVSPSLVGSQPWETAAGAPEGADGAGTGLNSALGAASPASSAPDGLAGTAQGDTVDTARAGDAGDGSPYADTQGATSSTSSSTQQGPADTAELPAAPAGALPSTELSPAAAPGDGAGAAPAPGEVSPPGATAPGYGGLEPNLLGDKGQGPSQAPGAPGAAFPPPVAESGTVFGTSDGAGTAANPDLGAAQGDPISPFLVGSQPWGMAAGAPAGAALPGVEGPGSGFSSALDVPSSASYGPVGPPSPTLGVQPGTALGVPGAEGQALGGSGMGSEPSLSSSAGAGVEAGMDLVPGAMSLPGPGDTLTAPSVSDTPSPGALGGAGAAPGAVQPALGAGPGPQPAAGGGGGEGAGAGAGESLGVSQDLDGAAGASGGGTGAVLHSASPSSSPEGSSSAGTSGGAAEGAGGPGAAVGPSPGLEAAGPQGNEETPVPAPGTQSGADFGLSDANLSQTNVVQLAGGETGASAPGAPSPGASGADGAGAIIQITSGVLAPSVLSSPLVPVAPDASSLLPAASAGGTGGSSAPAPNGGPPSASGTPSGSSPSAPGSPLPVAGAGSALPGSPKYEMASGMPAPLGEESPRAPVPPNAVPFLPPLQPGGPGVPPNPVVAEGRGDTDGPVLGEPRPGVAVGSGGAVGSLSVLPPAGPAAGSPLPNILGSGPAGGSSPPALRPSLGSATPANRVPAAGGASISAPNPGQGGAQRGSAPTTMRPTVSCSPSPAAPSPGGKKGLPGPGTNTTAALAARASSSKLPAPPRSAAAAPVPPPGPTVPAVSLYGYGPRENDREYVERRVDFNSPLFKPETGFPFGKTLRDSLYFTDNGQIIFPPSDSSTPTYPNPPPRGFNGHEEVPMIAVFWDNADFSRGTGTTFYQEFLTLNSEKPPFIRDVEAKVRRYLRSSYSAAWTLKITWDRAPAYGTRGDSRRTNTFQAVLTTDGFRSYVLLLYQDGGMRWDYRQLPAANVLIGYTSGDGSYHNDDLTQGPPAAKYRPDQFRGYNTDLRGLWLYRLESRVGLNYRLKCLAWTGRQQEPRMWSQDLPSCPCSLQQGQQDPRFKSSRGGWSSARVSMLHSASPNRYGAGVRCLYDSRGQLVEGRQERYWRSSRQVSPFRDQELKLYDWCCNQAASARLCARYGEKRPRIGCDGYQPLGTADSSEDIDSDEQTDEEDE
nr:collagen alpha-1(I) chain isoform X3 [Anas platyrhynchos]